MGDEHHEQHRATRDMLSETNERELGFAAKRRDTKPLDIRDEFEPKEKFEGPKADYVFKMGDMGLGCARGSCSRSQSAAGRSC